MASTDTHFIGPALRMAPRRKPRSGFSREMLGSERILQSSGGSERFQAAADGESYE
jgi:hypothetical protein